MSPSRDCPYAEMRAASDAVTEAALARLDARAAANRAAPRAGTIIEHKLSGERRWYGTTPLRQPLLTMDATEARPLPPMSGPCRATAAATRRAS